MARISVRYLASRKAVDGTIRFYWQPKTELVKAGWKMQRLPDDRELAIRKAETLNAELDAWRAGATVEGGPAPIPRVQAGTIADLIRRYKASPRYGKLGAKTQKDYAHHLRAIEERFGDAPAPALTRKVVVLYYESLCARDPAAAEGDDAPRAPAAANARMRVLRILMAYAYDLGEVETNTAAAPKLISTEPRLRVWSAAELAAAIAAADRLRMPSIGDAILIAHETGQRQGDVLRLTRLQVQGGRIRLRQRKRGARIDAPSTPELETRLVAALARLEAMATKAPTIVVCETTKQPWGSDHFRHAFAEIRAAAAAAVPSIADAWFSDLRDTAITNLAEAGCTVPEIASISGHTEGSVYGILKHYLALNGTIASAAIGKLVSHRDQRSARAAAEKSNGST